MFLRHACAQVTGLFHVVKQHINNPISHLALFSSISSVVAPMGQPNYAAANAQLNSWANTHSLEVGRDSDDQTLL